MNKKMVGIGSLGFAGVALVAGLQVPNKENPIDQKREDIILSMNAILNKQHITLAGKNQCMITIFGKRHKLKAILACDKIQVIEHEANISSNQDYVTQVININTLPNGSLDTNDGCFILESGGSQIIGGPDCEIDRISNDIDSQKSKPKLVI